jgi:hypothetical protein
MTKKLEEIFNISVNDQTELQDEDQQSQQASLPFDDTEKMQQVANTVEKVDRALPVVKDLEANDKEMDDLAQDAKDSFDTLMDLGMNVDPRYSGKMFEVASQLLGHAITAKNAKIDKKLKMVELQLKQARLEQMEKRHADDRGELEGEGMVVDRNELLKQLLEQNKDNE